MVDVHLAAVSLLRNLGSLEVKFNSVNRKLHNHNEQNNRRLEKRGEVGVGGNMERSNFFSSLSQSKNCKLNRFPEMVFAIINSATDSDSM